jgi:predicted transcriptional regulator
MMLIPMVCGPRGLFLAGGTNTVRAFAYPLPGARRADAPPADAPGGDSLKALLGEPRAELLRRLDRTVTVGSLAESMVYVPSAITYHVTSLERAGLVLRERSGRRVVVHRTARGTALVNLYDR